MQRTSLTMLMTILVATLAIVAAACGNDDDSGGGASSATPTATASGGGGGDACDDVTEAEVSSAVPDLSSITTWQCATDADDRPWVGGSGVEGSAGDGADVNFILETGGDVAFVKYDGDCANPPVPQSLLGFCEVS